MGDIGDVFCSQFWPGQKQKKKNMYPVKSTKKKKQF